MNILFVGNYRDRPSGWSDASRAYLKTLEKSDWNIMSRPYFYSSHTIDETFVEESNRLDPDVIIQCILPNDLEYFEGKKNVAVLFAETIKFLEGNNRWRANLSKMDLVLVSTQREADHLTELSIPNYIVPQPLTSELEPKNLLSDTGAYRYYFIGDSGDRKNLFKLIYAYMVEFSDEDNVELIIKSNNNSKGWLDNIAKVARPVGKPAPITWIDRFLTNEEMAGLHMDCDCFVMPSSGECYTRPLLEALRAGNKTLVTAGTSMATLDVDLTIDSYVDYCVSPNPPVPFIYRAVEQWRVPLIKSIAEGMRALQDNRTKAPKDMSYFSLENTLEKLKLAFTTL